MATFKYIKVFADNKKVHKRPYQTTLWLSCVPLAWPDQNNSQDPSKCHHVMIPTQKTVGGFTGVGISNVTFYSSDDRLLIKRYIDWVMVRKQNLFWKVKKGYRKYLLGD